MTYRTDNEHCPGPPKITGWRVGSNGTAFAVKVCACGQTMEYIEVEPQVEREWGKKEC